MHRHGERGAPLQYPSVLIHTIHFALSCPRPRTPDDSSCRTTDILNGIGYELQLLNLLTS